MSGLFLVMEHRTYQPREHGLSTADVRLRGMKVGRFPDRINKKWQAANGEIFSSSPRDELSFEMGPGFASQHDSPRVRHHLRDSTLWVLDNQS